jgi:hypothetical protein
LLFQRPSGTQKALGYLQCQYFITRSGRITRTMRGATRPKRAWVTQPTYQTAPSGLVWPSSVASALYFYVRLHLGRKPTPYFSSNFLRQRRNPSSTFGRADPVIQLLLPVGNRCHHHHRLLLGMGRSISITIPIISTISTSRFDVIPLLICGRLNHEYCLSVVCMFVLGILSLFCSEIIHSNCVVIHTPLIIIIFGTCGA